MRKIHLVPSHDPMASYDGFVDQEEAFRFLRRSALEYDNQDHFRNVWLQVLGAPGLRPPADDKMFRDLAFQLTSGRLRIARLKQTARATVVGGATVGETETATPPQKTLPDTHMMERIVPSMLRPELPVDPGPVVLPELDIDIAQQIAALIQAAKDGAPFCEQCQ